MPSRSPADPFLTGLQMLARRELFTTQLRARLVRRGFSADDTERAIARLRSDGALDDSRAAVAFAHDAAAIKMRGRERTRLELERFGLSREDADTAVATAYRDADERALVERALAKRLTGRVRTAAHYHRLYRALRRQGFDGGQITDALRAHTAGAGVASDRREEPSA